MVGFMKLGASCRSGLLLLSVFCLPDVQAQAQALQDPTRPALIEIAPVADGQAATPEQGPRLQSVLISPQRKLAIISGETYRLGQMVGAAKLVQIAADAVVLQQDGKQQVLLMYPGLEKKSADKK